MFKRMSLVEELNRSTIKGGAGSGNFGHSGRPGEIGGSESGKGYSKEEDKNMEPEERALYSGIRRMHPDMTRQQHESLLEAGRMDPLETPDVVLSRIENSSNYATRVEHIGDTPAKRHKRILQDLQG